MLHFPTPLLKDVGPLGITKAFQRLPLVMGPGGYVFIDI